MENLHLLGRLLLKSAALVVLARFPRLGKVKTRLQSHLSSRQCLALHRALLLDTLERLGAIEADRYLFLADCSQEQAADFSRRHRPVRSFRVGLQQGADLGARMWNACRRVSGPRRLALLGTDSPTLPLGYIRQGLQALARVPVAVGPAADGGYYLLALGQPRPELFRDIEWGGPRVLDQTLSRLSRDDYRLLPPWYDVDTPADLERLRRELNTEFEGFPVRTRKLLIQMV